MTLILWYYSTNGKSKINKVVRKPAANQTSQ